MRARTTTKIASLAAALLLSALPAHASTTQRFGAPFDCATDEVARRVGVLSVPASLPRVPSQTLGCSADVPSGSVVWTFVEAHAAGTVSVALPPGGVHPGTTGVCVFAYGPRGYSIACGLSATLSVRSGERVVVGAMISDVDLMRDAPHVAMVDAFDVAMP